MLSNYIYDSRAPRAACVLPVMEREIPSETAALDTRKLENFCMYSVNFPPAKLSFRFVQLKEMFLEAKEGQRFLTLNLEENIFSENSFSSANPRQTSSLRLA